ncbi:MAG TPA: hypothetical protein VGO90_02480 [Chthoniobacteraceae bacterium]|jgi:hypothetical protein|nr:hypothetical protein [Chthoniobacter sp.]HEV7866519.1 hypothetical protein [Chthoniobacteraceae bacterium]
MNEETITDTPEDFQTTASHAMQDARQTAEQAYARGEAYVRQNPVPVVLGALFVGFLLGMLLGRREEPTFRERYVDEPVNQMRDVLHSIFSPVAEKIHEQYTGAKDAASSFESRNVNPLLSEARRFGQKLRFW